jgi:hypothetical protein
MGFEDFPPFEASRATRSDHRGVSNRSASQEGACPDIRELFGSEWSACTSVRNNGSGRRRTVDGTRRSLCHRADARRASIGGGRGGPGGITQTTTASRLALARDRRLGFRFGCVSTDSLLQVAQKFRAKLPDDGRSWRLGADASLERKVNPGWHFERATGTAKSNESAWRTLGPLHCDESLVFC